LPVSDTSGEYKFKKEMKDGGIGFDSLAPGDEKRGKGKSLVGFVDGRENGEKKNFSTVGWVVPLRRFSSGRLVRRWWVSWGKQNTDEVPNCRRQGALRTRREWERGLY